MRLKTVLAAVGGVVLAILVGAFLVFRSFDFNRYKGLIAEQVKAATGRDLAIEGRLALEIAFSPTLMVEDVSFANAPWGSRPEMVKIRRLEVEVALLPLIFREIRVKRLILVEPDILLESDAKGIGNWSLSGATASAPPTSKTGEPPAGLTGLAVEKVRIEKGVVTYRDRRAKQAVRVVLDRLDLRAKGAMGPLAIELAAAFEGRAFSLAGTVGPLGEILAPSRPYPVTLVLKAGGASLEVDGTIAKPHEAAGVDLKVTARGQEIAEVARLTGMKIPALGPFSVTAQVTGSATALSLTDVDASVGRTGQVLVNATGAVKDALNAKGISLAVSVDAKDLRPTAKAFGVDLPPVPPVRASARVRDTQGGYAFDDTKASMGKTNVAGGWTLAIGGSRPKVRAQLASTLVDLEEIFPGGQTTPKGSTQSQEAQGPGQEKRVFPTGPLSLGALAAADADLDLRLDKLVLPNKLSLEALTAHLMLSGGRLVAESLSVRIGGGTLTGRVGLDASDGKTAVLAARADAKAIELGQVLQQIGKADLVTGTRTDLALNLRGSGGSVRDLMAGLSGDVLVILGEGKVNSKFIEWLGADLLTQIAEKVNPLGKADPYTELMCGVIRFTAKDGIASSDKGVAFETRKMTLVSSGTITLRTEAIDFTLRPDTRQLVGIGAGELVKLLRVRGTLAEPKFGINELEAARSALSIGAAVATGGLSFLAETLAKRAMADTHPCETALARKLAPAKTASVSPVAASSGQDTRQGHGVQQFFRSLFGN